jgi:hypothetical protein
VTAVEVPTVFIKVPCHWAISADRLALPRGTPEASIGPRGEWQVKRNSQRHLELGAIERSESLNGLEAAMTVQGSAITSESESPSLSSPRLLDTIKAPLQYRYTQGPWNGTDLPLMAHRSETDSIEPLSLQVRVIDSIACMGSVDRRWVRP